MRHDKVNFTTKYIIQPITGRIRKVIEVMDTKNFQPYTILIAMQKITKKNSDTIRKSIKLFAKGLGKIGKSRSVKIAIIIQFLTILPFLLKIKKTTKVDYVREPGDRLSNANIEKKYFKNLEVQKK